MYEYKVISEKDSTFAGGFDPEAIESALNEHAAAGWRLVDSFSTANLKKFGSEIMFILARSASSEDLSQIAPHRVIDPKKG